MVFSKNTIYLFLLLNSIEVKKYIFETEIYFIRTIYIKILQNIFIF